MSVTYRTESVPSADGGRFDALVAAPEAGGPGVLLLQEIFGVGEFIRDRAEQLATAGYVVLAPDVFWRIEPNVSLGHDEAGLAQAYGYVGRFSAIDPALTRSDLLAALAHLRSLPEVTGRVAVMGYCLGGTLAYQVAASGDPDACVSYYGSGVAAQLDQASAVSCPVILHFGGQDSFIPNRDVEAIAEAFADRHDVVVHIQPEAGHAFENAFAPVFSDPVAAAASWPITLDFLRTTIGSA